MFKGVVITTLGEQTIKTYSVWIVVIYALVLFSMTLDLFLGWRRAKSRGIARTSRALGATNDKAVKYFVPLLALLPADIIAIVVSPVPVFSMIYASFCIFREFKSVVEKTHTKDEIRDAANTVGVIVKNRDDLAKMISEVLHEIDSEREKKKNINNENDV